MDRGAAEAALRELEAGRAATWAQAEGRLQELVAGGGTRFRETFNAARALLGPAWPFGAEAAPKSAAAAPGTERASSP
jgi:hypothetical protein